MYLRWGHFTVLPMVAMVVLFFHQLSPSHRRLGIAAVATRAAAVLANFLTGESLSYTQITALRSIPIWDGDAIVGPVGIPNPWLALGQLSNLLLIASGIAMDIMVAAGSRAGTCGRLSRRPPPPRSSPPADRRWRGR